MHRGRADRRGGAARGDGRRRGALRRRRPVRPDRAGLRLRRDRARRATRAISRRCSSRAQSPGVFQAGRPIVAGIRPSRSDGGVRRVSAQLRAARELRGRSASAACRRSSAIDLDDRARHDPRPRRRERRRQVHARQDPRRRAPARTGRVARRRAHGRLSLAARRAAQTGSRSSPRSRRSSRTARCSRTSSSASRADFAGVVDRRAMRGATGSCVEQDRHRAPAAARSRARFASPTSRRSRSSARSRARRG